MRALVATAVALVAGCAARHQPIAAPASPSPAASAVSRTPPARDCRGIAALIAAGEADTALADQLARVPSAAWSRGSPSCWQEVSRALLARVTVTGMRDDPALAEALGSVHAWLAAHTRGVRTADLMFGLAAFHHARAAAAATTSREGLRALDAWAAGYRTVWGKVTLRDEPMHQPFRRSPLQRRRAMADAIERVLELGPGDEEPDDRETLVLRAGLFRYQLGEFAAAARLLGDLEVARESRVLASILLESLYRARLYREVQVQAPRLAPAVGRDAERYQLGARLAVIEESCNQDRSACAAALESLAREQPRNPAAASWRSRASELRASPAPPREN